MMRGLSGLYHEGGVAEKLEEVQNTIKSVELLFKLVILSAW